MVIHLQTVDKLIVIFQVSALYEAAKFHHTTWWWLKADGCDLVKGLKESVKLKWSGDVDLNDGELQEQYNKYIGRLESVKKAGLLQEHAEMNWDVFWKMSLMTCSTLNQVGRTNVLTMIIWVL